MLKERGDVLFVKFADRLKDVGALEGMPKMEGKRMLVMFAPKAQKKKSNSSELGKLIKEPPVEQKSDSAAADTNS